MIMYKCKECGGLMQQLILASHPPVYLIKCPRCNHEYRYKPSDKIEEI